MVPAEARMPREKDIPTIFPSGGEDDTTGWIYDTATGIIRVVESDG